MGEAVWEDRWQARRWQFGMTRNATGAQKGCLGAEPSAAVPASAWPTSPADTDHGHALRAIARQLGWGFRTVHRHARAQTWQELVDGKWQGPRPSKLDGFKAHLKQRFQQGATNAAQLHGEISALGYTGRPAGPGEGDGQWPPEPVKGRRKTWHIGTRRGQHERCQGKDLLRGGSFRTDP
jgi:hypothetical protein